MLKIFTYPNYKNSNYFLYLLVDGETTMKKVDRFLRDIWLDCCGHLSAFAYKGGGKLGMSKKLKDALNKGDVLEYEYDFGSTTDLQIKVEEEYPMGVKSKVLLLSRNEPLEIYCQKCKKLPAVHLCVAHLYEDQSHFFCESCAEIHEKECEGFLDYASMPVVNSPRMGECGYEGGFIDLERDGVFEIKK
ncbi:hypothetical protein [Capnocytophaga canimorsus]|uniref:hypothetical protein n=1 Tax=Capnocytophaga canimorsus TaxID=28188 RepID=UPI001E4356E3|nr:hypothetical protein [Capnocytophaga canimorsus]